MTDVNYNSVGAPTGTGHADAEWPWFAKSTIPSMQHPAAGTQTVLPANLSKHGASSSGGIHLADGVERIDSQYSPLGDSRSSLTAEPTPVPELYLSQSIYQVARRSPADQAALELHPAIAAAPDIRDVYHQPLLSDGHWNPNSVTGRSETPATAAVGHMLGAQHLMYPHVQVGFLAPNSHFPLHETLAGISSRLHAEIPAIDSAMTAGANAQASAAMPPQSFFYDRRLAPSLMTTGGGAARSGSHLAGSKSAHNPTDVLRTIYMGPLRRTANFKADVEFVLSQVIPREYIEKFDIECTKAAAQEYAVFILMRTEEQAQVVVSNRDQHRETFVQVPEELFAKASIRFELKGQKNCGLQWFSRRFATLSSDGFGGAMDSVGPRMNRQTRSTGHVSTGDQPQRQMHPPMKKGTRPDSRLQMQQMHALPTSFGSNIGHGSSETNPPDQQQVRLLESHVQRFMIGRKATAGAALLPPEWQVPSLVGPVGGAMTGGSEQQSESLGSPLAPALASLAPRLATVHTIAAPAAPGLPAGTGAGAGTGVGAASGLAVAPSVAGLQGATSKSTSGQICYEAIYQGFCPRPGCNKLHNGDRFEVMSTVIRAQRDIGDFETRRGKGTVPPCENFSVTGTCVFGGHCGYQHSLRIHQRFLQLVAERSGKPVAGEDALQQVGADVSEHAPQVHLAAPRRTAASRPLMPSTASATGPLGTAARDPLTGQAVALVADAVGGLHLLQPQHPSMFVAGYQPLGPTSIHGPGLAAGPSTGLHVEWSGAMNQEMNLSSWLQWVSSAPDKSALSGKALSSTVRSQTASHGHH